VLRCSGSSKTQAAAVAKKKKKQKRCSGTAVCCKFCLKKLEDCFSFFLQLDKKKCQLLVSFIAPAVLAIQTSCCSGALQLAAVGLKMTALQRILKPCALQHVPIRVDSLFPKTPVITPNKTNHSARTHIRRYPL
jgi:hypothetical protein